MTVNNIAAQAEEPKISIDSGAQNAPVCESPAEEFINKWNNAFGQRVFAMPHMATRTMHTTIGLLLRDVYTHFHGSYIDLRDSSIIMQDSGTGKKPTIEFLEEIVKHLSFNLRRRSTITSAGAVGTVVIEEVIDPETACRHKQGIVVYGDLKNVDLLTCSEADSILLSKIDNFGNDLLTNLCDSQDPNNQISKKLANGEVDPFTSRTSLFLTTTVPNNINPRWFEKGLFQRFGISIKRVSLDQYQKLRDDLITVAGEKAEASDEIKDLAESLKSKRVPDQFEFSSEVKTAILEKAHLLDSMLIDLRKPAILNCLKSFTVRRDLKMTAYACHHAWLDERTELNRQDVDYAYRIAAESWNDVLNFVVGNASTVQSCPNAIMNLMSDGRKRSIDEIREALKSFSDQNVRYSLSTLSKSGLLAHPEREHYAKLES